MACKVSSRSLSLSVSAIIPVKPRPSFYQIAPASARACHQNLSTIHPSPSTRSMGRMIHAAGFAAADFRCRVGASPSSSTEAQELTVQDAMEEDPFVLAERTPIREAVEKMLACGASAAIVVTSEKGRQRVVGMLSETDLLWKGAGAPEAHYVIPPVYVPLLEATFSWPDKQAFDTEAKKVLAKTVGDAMTRQPVTISTSAPLSKAATMMLHNKVSQLPVLDADGYLVGSISRHDVLAALVTKHSPFFT